MLGFIKENSLRAGAATAVAMPLAIFIAATLIMSEGAPWWQYLRTMFIFGALSKIMSLCVYPNLVLFYLYLHFKRDTSAKGVVVGTLAMALVVVILFVGQKIY